MSVGVFRLVQNQPGADEAAFKQAGPVLDLLKSMPDGPDQVAEGDDGKVGQHVAL